MYLEKPIQNDIDALSAFSHKEGGMDFSGLIIMREGIPTMNFGKYKDQEIAQVVKDDQGYLVWLLNQKLTNEKGEEDWIYTLKYYLGNKN